MSPLEEINTNNRHQGVGIVGAGLVGCLAALAFAAKGFSVTLFEFRDDPSTVSQKEKNLRSINLAVSSRGIGALKYVDEAMADRILENVIPMKGRMIHTGLKQESQLYGLFGESINSIDRAYLNEYLLDEIRHSEVNVLFKHKLIKLDNLSEEQTPKMTFIDMASEDLENRTKTFEFDYVVGADGAHSQFRYQLQRSMRMNVSQQYVDMQYLELYIPPSKDAESKFSIDPNHLHIWPRHNFMLIALANKDGSFTSTFFSPWSVIENIKTSDEFIDFFKENFPDAFELIGSENLKQVYDSNPRGSLMQVDVYPYNNPSGRAIIIGDAAHSMVPFYGQGMNCGFEDVKVLMEIIDRNNGNVSQAFKDYSVERKQDLNAICKLAMDNFQEMSSKVTSPWYLIRKKLDYTLGKYANGRLFQWLPLYTMISFRDDISYAKAIEIEKRQTVILNNIQYGTLGAIAIFGIAKAAQFWNQMSRN